MTEEPKRPLKSVTKAVRRLSNIADALDALTRGLSPEEGDGEITFDFRLGGDIEIRCSGRMPCTVWGADLNRLKDSDA